MRNKFSIGFLMVSAAFVFFSCNGSTSTDSTTKMDVIDDQPITDTLTTDPANFPVFSVSDTLHDFGQIEQGDIVSYSFHFKNTGSKPLIIRGASSTCGCTVPEYPKEPVPPGESGILKVVFNSAGKAGRQVKPIFVQANTKPTMFQLAIICNVVEPAKETN